jgi:hypothetical protein
MQSGGPEGRQNAELDELRLASVPAEIHKTRVPEQHLRKSRNQSLNNCHMDQSLNIGYKYKLRRSVIYSKKRDTQYKSEHSNIQDDTQNIQTEDIRKTHPDFTANQSNYFPHPALVKPLLDFTKVYKI